MSLKLNDVRFSTSLMMHNVSRLRI